MISDISPLIPAATVILLRDTDAGVKVLMLRRNRRLKAFGGAWVFPGGRVDDADGPGEREEERARIAACREAMEETGLRLDPNKLVSLSHWIPPKEEKRRFSTRFYVAAAPDDDVIIDDGEIHEFKWVRPDDVVLATPNPDMVIMPPTFISLHDLKGFKSVAAALEDTASRGDELFETRFIRGEGGFTTLWEPDAGYSTGNLDTPGARRRLIAGANGWNYLKDF